MGIISALCGAVIRRQAVGEPASNVQTSDLILEQSNVVKEVSEIWTRSPFTRQ